MGILQLRRSQDRGRLFGQGGHVHVDGPRHQPRVGGDPITLGEKEHVADDDLAGGDRHAGAVAADRGLGRQVAAQRIDRALGLALLHEGDGRAQDHDAGDGDSQGPSPRDRGEACGGPEQECDRMDELRRDLARPGGPTRDASAHWGRAPRAAGRLPRAPPRGVGAEVAEEPLDELERLGGGLDPGRHLTSRPAGSSPWPPGWRAGRGRPRWRRSARARR